MIILFDNVNNNKQQPQLPPPISKPVNPENLTVSNPISPMTKVMPSVNNNIQQVGQ